MTTPRPPRRSRPRTSRRIAALAGLVTLVVVAGACGGSASPSTTASTSSTSAATAAAPAALVAARPYVVHVPPGGAARPAPLLILLHGYGVSGAAQEAYLKLAPAADAHGMLYVHLDGTENALGQRFWNATDACCDPRNHVDDSAYIAAVIADVKAHYDVDPRRVFLVGHSNGGFMSYRMACDHADVVAAIVSLEGATWSDPSKCAPTEPVATLEIHGTADKTIAYDGGTIRTARYPGARKTVATWAWYDGCEATPDRRAPRRHAIVTGLPPATVVAYSTGCDRNGHAELWTQRAGMHVPPVSPTFADQVVTFLLAHPKH